MTVARARKPSNWSRQTNCVDAGRQRIPPLPSCHCHNASCHCHNAVNGGGPELGRRAQRHIAPIFHPQSTSCSGFTIGQMPLISCQNARNKIQFNGVLMVSGSCEPTSPSRNELAPPVRRKTTKKYKIVR